ncbi:unnamed protein product [Darwinula stevensoni]|uniref:Apple domain-containing protein n=1 Tax=Darwinula stevensoni TaxID=69355 RepID=A0A7R9A3T5_9CRUS|nr:unnamed protein product [Darwinula stevensoni]CAG0891252.1 unnamed protein product [Darwinula stevensoni]
MTRLGRGTKAPTCTANYGRHKARESARRFLQIWLRFRYRPQRKRDVVVPGRGMVDFFTPVLISCLFWAGSSSIIVHYAVHQGRRYGNVSHQSQENNFEDCYKKCLGMNPSGPCLAFNFRERDGFCQLIHNGKSGLVPSDGYQAYVQCRYGVKNPSRRCASRVKVFDGNKAGKEVRSRQTHVHECLTDYPRIEHAKESFVDWTGEHPAPRGGKVKFACIHPRGFKDGLKEHHATCSSAVADVWCTTFTEGEKDLCPHPLSCVTEHPKMENAVMAYDGWDGKYPAPPGAKVIYTCHRSMRFTDGLPTHEATCSFQPDDAWKTSFHGEEIRCRGNSIFEGENVSSDARVFLEVHASNDEFAKRGPSSRREGFSADP